MILNANYGSHGVWEKDEQCTRLVMMRGLFRFGIWLGKLGCCVVVSHLTVDKLPTVGPKIMIEMFLPLEID